MERPITGPACCWRSARITLVCCVCGEHSEIMHSPTRAAGVYCPVHCVACNPVPEAPAARSAATPLPETRGAVLANSGAGGGGFNFGKRYQQVFGCGEGRRACGLFRVSTFQRRSKLNEHIDSPETKRHRTFSDG